MFSAGLASVWVDTGHKQQFDNKQVRPFVFVVIHDFSLLFCDCGSAEKLLRPPNAIIPFPLSASYLSGPFCYPASSQIASSPVSAFILSPPCLGSKPLPSSDSIKKHNFSSCGSDQIGWLMHFSCVLSFFFPMYLIFTYRLSIYQSAFLDRFTVVHFIKPCWIYVYLMKSWCRECNSLNKGVYLVCAVNNNEWGVNNWTCLQLLFSLDACCSFTSIM